MYDDDDESDDDRYRRRRRAEKANATFDNVLLHLHFRPVIYHERIDTDLHLDNDPVEQRIYTDEFLVDFL